MRIIISLIVFFSWSGLCAQINAGDPNNNEFRLFDAGFSAGLNFSQVDGDDLAGFNKFGLNVGPIIHVNFSRTWSASLELLYSQKGARTKPNTINFNTYSLALDYAEVPILANYNDKNRLIFQAGIAYGRLVNLREELNGIDPLNAYNDDELSYIIGGTFLIGEEKHWGVNARYQGSITTIGPSANPLILGKVNRLISLRGVYYF
jgi:hypothetical protein